MISNVDGSLLDSVSSSYLCKHLRQPVRIDLTLDTLVKQFEDVRCIVEIGPPGLLQSLLRLRKSHVQVVRTIPSKSESMWSEEPSLLKAIANLWCHGYEVNFKRLVGYHGHYWRLPGELKRASDYDVYFITGYQFDRRTWTIVDADVVKKDKRRRSFKSYRPGWKLVAQFPPDNGALSIQGFLVVSRLTPKNQRAVSSELQSTASTHAFHVHLTDGQFSSSGREVVMDSTAANYERLGQMLRSRCFVPQTIVHIVDKESASMQSTFYCLYNLHQHLQLSSSPAFICISLAEHSSSDAMKIGCAKGFQSTSYGALQEIANRIAKARCFSVEADSIEQLPQLVRHFTTSSNFGCCGRYLLRNQALFDSLYCKDDLPAANCSNRIKSRIYILIGGTGHIGLAYAKEILQLDAGAKLVFLSRTASSATKDIQAQLGNHDVVEGHDVDVSDAEALTRLIMRIRSEHECISGILYAAGAATQMTLHKDEHEMANVFKSKVQGVRNLLEALEKSNSSVDWLIFTSSLTGNLRALLKLLKSVV